MARTFQEIYERIIAEKESFSSLDPLDPQPESFEKFKEDIRSTSSVANWRLFYAIVAAMQFDNEVLMDIVKEEVEERLTEQGIGQLPWYTRLAKDYRHGYALQFQNKKYLYSSSAVDDQNAAVVQRSSAVDEGGQIRVKTANVDSSGVPVANTQSEVNGIQSYIDKIKPAGVEVVVFSAAPDEINIELEVIYDPTVMKPTGELINDNSKKPVNDAINGYIRELDFDSIFNLNEVVDRIQEARGVRDPRLLKAEARPAGGSTYDVLFDVTNSGPTKPKDYRAQAGHLKIQSISVTYKA